MAWWRRRQGRGGPQVAPPAHVPRHRAGSWAEPALPPPAAEPAVEPQLVSATPGVRLGFADGSELELDAAHPSARALRAVADLIVQEDAERAENSTGSASTARPVRWRQAAAEGP